MHTTHSKQLPEAGRREARREAAASGVCAKDLPPLLVGGRADASLRLLPPYAVHHLITTPPPPPHAHTQHHHHHHHTFVEGWRHPPVEGMPRGVPWPAPAQLHPAAAACLGQRGSVPAGIAGTAAEGAGRKGTHLGNAVHRWVSRDLIFSQHGCYHHHRQSAAAAGRVECAGSCEAVADCWQALWSGCQLSTAVCQQPRLPSQVQEQPRMRWPGGSPPPPACRKGKPPCQPAERKKARKKEYAVGVNWCATSATPPAGCREGAPRPQPHSPAAMHTSGSPGGQPQPPAEPPRIGQVCPQAADVPARHPSSRRRLRCPCQHVPGLRPWQSGGR